MPEPAAVAVLVLTAGVFAVLVPFASHRGWLVLQSRRRKAENRAPWPESALPRVTVQLPMFNERAVAGRAVDAAAALDYPAHLLDIQVLDDSDDETSSIVERRVAHWRRRGVEVQHLRRGDRTGYKAGALAFGTERAKGEFILILDADFVPPPELVRSLLPPMRDPGVGMVQAAWGHLNRDRNWLTRAQSYLLDGHFLFEQGGRYRGGRFFNFNGTAGLWRRRCLDEAGGWQADTLTEDLDVSYRAQMAGWRFAYLDDVRVPAEIPESVAALEVQQRRWAQGGIQTGRKILPRLLRSDQPAGVKLEAVVHLFGHLAHPLTWALALLLFPSAVARRTLGLEHLLGLDLVLFGAATVPFLVFYWLAGEGRGRPRSGRLREVLQTLALGIGLSVSVSRAVARGLRGSVDPFARTPKRGGGSAGLGLGFDDDRGSAEDRHVDADGARNPPASAGGAYPSPVASLDVAMKLAMAGILSVYLAAALAGGYWGQLPFIVLFLSGYLGLGLPLLRERIRRTGSMAPSARSGIAFRLVPVPAGLQAQEEEERDPEKSPDPQGLSPGAGLLVPR